MVKLFEERSAREKVIGFEREASGGVKVGQVGESRGRIGRV